MMGVAYLLKLCHSEREARVKGQKREDTKKFIEVRWVHTGRGPLR